MAAVEAESKALENRLSPGFVLFHEEGDLIPLRALTRLDGYGRLGLLLVYSEHLGADALRPSMATFGLDPAKDDPLLLARYIDDFPYCIATEPLHDEEDRKANKATQMAFKPDLKHVMMGLVRSRIVAPTGRMSKNYAYILDATNVASWQKLQLEDGPVAVRILDK